MTASVNFSCVVESMTAHERRDSSSQYVAENSNFNVAFCSYRKNFDEGGLSIHYTIACRLAMFKSCAFKTQESATAATRR